jgi:hypothetical protein
MENLELRHVRNFARQRAKLVVVEEEFPQVLHAEQLGWELHQTHVRQLKAMCELSR